VVRHRATTHENVRLAVKQAVRARYLAGDFEAPEPSGRDASIPREVGDALTLEYYAKHYRAWLDEPVPALDGETPRAAAKDRRLRPRVVELIQGLEGMYQGALRRREAAYDPSWMWSELGLVDPDASQHPPPLAHERVAMAVPGSGELSRAVAERVRGDRRFDDGSSLLSLDAFDRDLDVQRFLRTERPAANDSGGEGSPLAGQILEVATVYVTEELREVGRALDVVFALDALGSDLPELVRYEIPLGDEAPVSGYLDEVAPLPPIEPAPPDTSPVRGLLRATLNAILYATSAGVDPVLRVPPKQGERRARRHAATLQAYASDEVYFLPGAIDITRVRRLQELERASEGAVMLRRFMVRGHWRRAPERWADRRLRWIEPYWKGPDVAAIIERVYRLKG
jgi:hypothetical protein